MLYELYAAQKLSNTHWSADSAAIFNLSSNSMRGQKFWTSADAAGLPIFPGLVRGEEVTGNNEIEHAIRFTMPSGYILDQFTWPATHCAAGDSDVCDGTQAGRTITQNPPMGTRFRLKACFDISQYSLQVGCRCFFGGTTTTLN